MHFDPVVVLNHFVAPGVAEPSTIGGANAQGRSLDKRIRSCIAFFVESSTSEKKCLAEAKKRVTHFIRQVNDLRFAGTTKTTISLFPFFGATFFFQGMGCIITFFLGCPGTTPRSIKEKMLEPHGNKTRSFRSIFSKIVKDIPLVMKKGVEGICICCSGRLEGAEIARTECGKYGKTSRNVFNQKIYYAPAEVSTRYGISSVKVWISYSRCSRGCKSDGTQLGFGRYGTQSYRAGRLSYRAIEAARLLVDIPITGKPTEVRMGREKGNPTGWIARVSRVQILFEIDGVSLSNARQATTLAAHKLWKVEEIQSLFFGAEQSKNEPNQMIVLEWLFLKIDPCDVTELWQLGSQDAATPIMQETTTYITIIIPMFIAIPSFALLYSMDELNMVHEASGLPVISHSRHRETLITIACQKWGVEVVRPIPRNAPSIGDYGSIVVVAGAGDSTSQLELVVGPVGIMHTGTWEFEAVVLPAKSHICFIVTSADVPHSWVVLSLGVKCDAILGRLNQTSISVQRERFYYGQYSEICGTNHAFMPIIVEAVPKKDYGSRVSNQLIP
ncbi:cytochrome c oxidase subunit 2 [Capsicum annuum]